MKKIMINNYLKQIILLLILVLVSFTNLASADVYSYADDEPIEENPINPVTPSNCEVVKGQIKLSPQLQNQVHIVSSEESPRGLTAFFNRIGRTFIKFFANVIQFKSGPFSNEDKFKFQTADHTVANSTYTYYSESWFNRNVDNYSKLSFNTLNNSAVITLLDKRNPNASLGTINLINCQQAGSSSVISSM